jgi:hypothetical protein
MLFDLRKKLLVCTARLLLASLLTLDLWGQTDPASAVVIIVVEFPNNATEIGTGAFIDHDGLILTADHVVHQSYLSPPATYTNGSLPTESAPTKITVYSAALRQSLPVDLNLVVSGVLSSSPAQWMDVALLRVSLTPEQRAMIEPLRLAAQGPHQGDPANAWGPRCTDVSTDRCLTPFPVPTGIGSDPTISRDYEVRDNVTLGYSGGPLTNSLGDIIGIASWGDRGVGEQIVRTSYISSAYIRRYFDQKSPPSGWINATAACQNTKSLKYLTRFDFNELFPKNLQAAPTDDQCSCCCDSLDRASNDADVPASMNSCQRPPFCPEKKFYSAMNTVRLAIETKTVDQDTVASYLDMRAALAAIDMSKVPAEKKTEFYNGFALTGALLSSAPHPSSVSSLSFARTDALIAYKKSVQILEVPETYFKMGSLLQEQGDVVRSTAANLLGALTEAPVEKRKEFKVNEKDLKTKLFDKIPASLPVASVQ